MFEPLEILRTLAKHDVEFILVGGLSATIQGVALDTFDADVVHSRRPENVSRLLRALAELDAHYRIRSDRKLSPNESHLSSPGHQLLTTKYGVLDVLGAIGDGLSYEDLMGDSSPLEIAAGLHVRTLSLEKYVELKEKLNQEKDRAALPLLRTALRAKREIARAAASEEPLQD
jgi:predicted nucleotidyltransferase